MIDTNHSYWSKVTPPAISYTQVVESIISFVKGYIMLDRNALIAAVDNCKGRRYLAVSATVL